MVGKECESLAVFVQSPYTVCPEHVTTMADSKSVEERFQLITRGLEEIIAGDNNHELKEILATKEHPVIYWGTATTGKPHLGYFVPIYKISDYLAGTH